MENQTRRQFVQTLFIATQAVVTAGLLRPIAALADSTTAAARPTLTHRPGVHFLAIGDWGRQGVPEQRRVATQMGILAHATKPAFITALGDNFYEIGTTSVDDPHWQDSYNDIYTHDSLQIPWYAILGNHDYRGVPDSQIAYAKQSPRWRMPALYYDQTFSADKTDVHCFFLDTNPFITKYETDTRMHPSLNQQGTAAQLAWLDAKLAASTAPWKLVLGHHPIFSGGKHGDSPELTEQLLPILKKHKVQAYLCGHDHDLQHLQSESIHFIISGAGSTVRPTAATQRTIYTVSTSGFTSLVLHHDTLHFEMVDENGALMYKAAIKREA